MIPKPRRKDRIVGVAMGALFLAGTLGACAPGSLALQTATTPTPAVGIQGAPAASRVGVASGGPTLQVRAAPASSSGIATSAQATSGLAVPVAPSPPTAAVSGVRGIEVTGNGQVEARPDEAIIQVGVQTRAATAQDAQASNNTSMQSVIAAIKALNIPDKDIQTSGVSLYPTIEQNQTITGYNAMNDVTVMVENVDQAGAVFDAAVKAGANTSRNIRFAFKDETGLRNKALAAAAADAKSKAAVLAGALGLQISGVQSVIEGQVNIPRPFAVGVAASGAAQAPSVPIEPGQQTVTAQVTVVFGY